MDNYKIKVNDEAESKEAQELFFELGFRWKWTQDKEVLRESTPYLFTLGANIGYGLTLTKFDECVGKELTLPQLRDLVVLKRNDINDATHTDEDRRAYLDSEGKYHFYIHAEHKWEYSQDVQYVGKYLKPINKPQDPALISGADALRALADGVKPEEIEGKYSTGLETYFLSMDGKVDVFLKYLNEKMFRIKPQTIKLELELPKPFEPKVGEEVFYINDTNKSGYCVDEHQAHYNYNFGVWRTEEEIKQVVEQLRKIRGAS